MSYKIVNDYHRVFLSLIFFFFDFVSSNHQTDLSANNSTVSTGNSTVAVQQQPTAVNGTVARAQRKHHKHGRKSRAQNNKPKGTKPKVQIILL